MILNPPQLEAVNHTDGPLLVLAGPGSGKTRVLVHRIARLVDEGVAYPSEILSVTFTNKAAGEMRKRLEELVGNRARELTVGTFHSVCLRLLRKHAEHVGYGDRFLVYDGADQMALVKECMNTLNIDQARMPPRAIVERISRSKDACMGPDDFASEAKGNPYLDRISKIYNLYQRRLGELQAMDFGDLIRFVVKLFDDEPAILESYQRRWKYVLVDEYQDINHAQYRLVGQLAREHQSICVVGDDDQSIYRWRGADVSNILRFEKDFHGSKVIRLEQNYRSTKSILSAANAVVANNAGRKNKTIWTDNEQGEKIVVLACDSERREAQSVADRIAKGRDSGKRYGDVAIFYRTNAQSRPLEDTFRAEGIPYRIFGGIRFYERAEVKNVLAYLRLLIDPDDDIAFKRIINVPTRGIGKTTVSRLEEYARQNYLSLFSAIDDFVKTDAVRSAAQKRLVAFSQMMKGLILSSNARPLGDLVRDVLEKSGYIEALVSVSSIEAEGKIENINELVTAMEEFIPQNEGPMLNEFLDQVALVSDTDNMDDSQGIVTMMTMHLAKGLEFPCVFMVGMEEGLFPHARSLDDPDELEEERRLCYVGMTRAMERLTLTHAFRRRQFGTEKYSVSSRFLDEIPSEYVDKVSFGAVDAYAKPHSFGPRRSTDHCEDISVIPAKAGISRNSWDPPVKPGDDFSSQGHSTESSLHSYGGDSDFDFDQRLPEEIHGAYPKGMRVRHPTFGIGAVMSCKRTSAGHKVTVRFQSGQVKKLIAECAGLVCL